jgi:hypothetical protein
MANPLLLQHANTVFYVGDFSSLPDHLISDSILQRNPEHSSFYSSLSDPELVDQPCREYPRLLFSRKIIFQVEILLSCEFTTPKSAVISQVYYFSLIPYTIDGKSK